MAKQTTPAQPPVIEHDWELTWWEVAENNATECQPATIEVFEAQDYSGLVLWSYRVIGPMRVVKVGAGWTSAQFALDDARLWARNNRFTVVVENVDGPSLSLLYGV